MTAVVSRRDVIHATHGLTRATHRRRLVQHQDGRVFQQRPRDGEALSLAAAQPQASLAHFRVVALGQGGNKGVQLCG